MKWFGRVASKTTGAATYSAPENGDCNGAAPARSQSGVVAMAWVGHLFFLAYLAHAVVFWRDRVLYDTSVFLNTGPLLDGVPFRALDRLSVQIPPQVLPLIVVHFGGSSQFAAMAYSFNFALFHYGIWLLLVYAFRRIDLGVAFVASILLHLVHNNIFIQADLMHAMGYMLLLYSVADAPPELRFGRGNLRKALLILFGLTACFGHPLMALMTLYCIAFVMLRRRRFDRQLLVVTLIPIALYAASKFTVGAGYESGAFIKTLMLSHLLESLPLLPNYLLRAHWPLALFLAAFMFAAMRGPNARGIIALTVGMVFVLLAAFCSWIPLYEHSNWQFSGYTWMYFLSIYFVLMIPIFDRGPLPQEAGSQRNVYRMRLLICLVSLVWAGFGSAMDFKLSRERQLFIARVRDALAGDAPPIYLIDDQFSTNPLLRENDLTLWDDSLLISSYDGPKMACMIIPPYAWKEGEADIYRKRYRYRMNERYFDIPPADRFSPHAVNSVVSLEALRKAALNLKLEHPRKPTDLSYVGGAREDYLKPLEVVYSVPVTFTNQGTSPMPSRVSPGNENDRPIPVTVGYRWEVRGRPIAEVREAETLPIDIPRSFVHNVHVHRKGVPPDAELVVGLFVGRRFVPCANVESWPLAD